MTRNTLLQRENNGSENEGKNNIFHECKGGGVGKTSIAVNVANFCAHYKMKVLLVDCDLRTRGATHFLEIATISLKEGASITLNHIIDDILNQKIINAQNGEDDESNKDDENAKGGLPVLTAKDFKFIPASLQPYGFTSTFLYHDPKKIQ